MSEEHLTLPFDLPALDHLSNEELGKLRSKFSEVSREARRKSHQVIARHEALKKPWGRNLHINKDTPAAERAEIQREFERELLRVPEAYLAHAWANSLIILDSHCRDELLRRTGSANPKKKPPPVAVAPKSEAVPPSAPPKNLPPPATESTEAEEAVDMGAVVAAMFDQAGDE